MKRLGSLLTLVVLASLAIATACSNQGEGERCEVANGNDDCSVDDGLICYEAAKLTSTTSDRCCPIDRSKATHPACKTQVSVLDGSVFTPDTGAATVPDTGSPELPDANGETDASDASTIVDAADQ